MKAVAFALVLTCLGALAALPADAQPKAQVDKVSFSFVVIEGSETTGDAQVDDKLKDIKDELLAATKYKKFKYVDSKSYSYPDRTQIGAKLPEGYHLTMVTKITTTGTGRNKKIVPTVEIWVTHKSNKKKAILHVEVPLKTNKPNFVEVPVAADKSIVLCFIGR